VVIVNQKNEVNRKEEYLNQRVDKRINYGTKRIRHRLYFKNSTRFLLDIDRRIIHDTANETKQCHLDELFKSGAAETYLRTVTEAVSEGYTTCRRCIGVEDL